MELPSDPNRHELARIAFADSAVEPKAVSTTLAVDVAPVDVAPVDAALVDAAVRADETLDVVDGTGAVDELAGAALDVVATFEVVAVDDPATVASQFLDSNPVVAAEIVPTCFATVAVVAATDAN